MAHPATGPRKLEGGGRHDLGWKTGKVRWQPRLRSGEGRCGQWWVVRDISFHSFLLFSLIQGS